MMRLRTICFGSVCLGNIFFIFLSIGMVGCGAAIPAARETRGYILISIDTLRADHLGVYGYDKPTSPFIDSLAARGVLFESAYAQLPGTLPSHMSIFTGLYPAEHGVYPPDGLLAPSLESLPETFRQNGFRTAGFTEGGYMHGSYGFNRGFDEFNDEIQERYDDIERTMTRGLDFLKSLDEDERFFLFLHTYSVHDPYEPPEPYAAQFDAAPPAAAFAPTGPNFELFNRGSLTLVPGAVDYYRAAYDASIRYTDNVLEKFVTDLEALDLYDDLTLVLTSDHGEEFFEHGRFVHEQIYRETLHVPLLVLHPDASPRRVQSIARSIDIAPTLSDLANLKQAPVYSGTSLVALLLGGADEGRSESYAESFDATHRTVVRRDGEDLFQYLELSPKFINDGVWVESKLEFDHLADHLDFWVMPYHEARDLKVFVNGELLRTIALDPENGIRVQLDLGENTRRRVTLASDTCTRPMDIGGGNDLRCISFRLFKMHVARGELYDLHADPMAAAELSYERPRQTRALYEALRQYPRGSGDSTNKQQLDPELERRLKALGYIQ